MAPFLIANRGCKLPQFRVKLRAGRREAKWYRKWEFLSAIRVWGGASAEDGRLPVIYFPGILGEIAGAPCVAEVSPFLLAYRGWGLPKFWAKLGAAGGG